MKVQIFTCLLLLLGAGMCSLPTQGSDDSKAVEISSSGSNLNLTNTDLAGGCSWSFSYTIRGSGQYNRAAINKVLGAFFNRLCGVGK